MSNALTVIENYAVMKSGSALGAAVSANLGDGGISPFELDRVRVPAGGGTLWTVPTLDGEKEEKSIEGVIVHWRAPRAYWRESFDETGGGTPPDCSSDDGVTGVGDPGGSCSVCPLARYGSAAKGRGQACRQMKLLFIVREGDGLPIVVVVPPSSLRAVGSYFLRLAGQQMKYHQVVTRLTLEKTKNKDGIAYSQVAAGRVAVLSPEEAAAIEQYAKGLAPLFASVRIDEEGDA